MEKVEKFDPSFAFYSCKNGNGMKATITKELADLVASNIGGVLFLKTRENRAHDRIPEKEAVVLPPRK